jgi:chemotaxis protein CheD
MASVNVGIAEMRVLRGQPVDIVTHALGSCIGVAIYDSITHVGGLLHYLLPQSSLSPDDAKINPMKFGDTGIPALFQEAYRLGAAKDNLKVVIAGGGHFLAHATIDVGSRNVAIARRLFLKNRILIAGEAVGGDKPRTLRLDLQSGAITCREGALERVLA